MTAPASLMRATGATTRLGARGSRWLTFLARRIMRMVMAMFVVVTAAFLVLRLSGGDPVRNALGPTASESVVQARREQLGLDQPLIAQFVSYLAGLLRGDLGVSLVTGRSVSEL